MMDILSNIIFANVLICMVAMVIIWGRAVVINAKLILYMQKHNPDRYAWLIIPEMGPWSVNPIHWLKYVHNDVDNNDAIIFKYKRQIRHSEKWVLAIFAELMLVVIAVAFLACYQKHP